jgi:hypothetical protein
VCIFTFEWFLQHYYNQLLIGLVEIYFNQHDLCVCFCMARVNDFVFKIDSEEEEKTSVNNNRIEKLDNNRTIIRVGESEKTNNIYDGQYLFTHDKPPILIYYLYLPFETLMDAIRIQSDPKLNLLKIFVEQKENEQQNKLIIRSTSRVCRLPKDHLYDYTRLRVNFLKDNFLRIEMPTLN